MHLTTSHCHWFINHSLESLHVNNPQSINILWALQIIYLFYFSECRIFFEIFLRTVPIDVLCSTSDKQRMFQKSKTQLLFKKALYVVAALTTFFDRLPRWTVHWITSISIIYLFPFASKKLLSCVHTVHRRFVTFRTHLPHCGILKVRTFKANWGLGTSVEGWDLIYVFHWQIFLIYSQRFSRFVT